MSHHRRGCDSGADLSHLGPKPELPSVIEDPRCDDDLLRAPDADAFGAFYARHARAVEVVLRPAHGRSRARLRPHRRDVRGRTDRAPAVPGRGAPARAWLYTIAARRLADHRRRAAAEDRLHARLMAHRRTEARGRPGALRRGGRRPSAGAARAAATRAARGDRRARPRRARLSRHRPSHRRLRGRRAPARLARARHHAPAGAGAPGRRAACSTRR